MFIDDWWRLARKERTSRAARITGVALAVVVVSVFSGAASASAPTSTARVVSWPSAGPSGSSSTVVVRQFPPLDKVRVLFSGQLLGRARTTSSGTARISIVIPLRAIPGLHSLVVTDGSLRRQTSFRVRTNWPQQRYSPRASGFNPHEVLLSKSTIFDLHQLWGATGGGTGPLEDTPIVANGIVFGAGSEGPEAYNEVTGKLLWEIDTSDPGAGPARGPAVYKDLVIFAFSDGQFWALNQQSGAVVWSLLTAGSSPNAAPVVDGNYVFVTLANDHVAALDAATGAEVWSTDLGENALLPAIGHGMIYLTTEDYLFGIRESDGSIVFRTPVTGGGVSPSLYNGDVYVGLGDDLVAAYDASSGDKVWQAALGGYVDFSPAAANGVIYASNGSGGKLYALDAATGKVIGEAETGGGVTAPPVVANDVVYVDTTAKDLEAYDGAVTARLLTYSLPVTSGNAPSIVDGIIFLSAGNLFALSIPAVG